MRCECGLSVPHTKAPRSHGCPSCGAPLKLDVDDLTLHNYNAPDREVRPGQVLMARLVDDIIRKKNFAVIEGPVGSGKSDGYSIPSILAGKRVVIATAKKQLQHQIARKDIPYIAQRLERPISAALLKGKSNYACHLKSSILTPEDRADFRRWLSESEYGDLSDYPGKRPHYWFDVTAEDCVGSRCEFSKRCGYWKAKKQTKAAQIIIANHHVVAFDLRYGPFTVLGEYDVLIIDEAHQAPSAFRSAYGLTISSHSVKRIIKSVDHAGLNTGLEARLEKEWAAMFSHVTSVDGEVPKDPFGASGDAVMDLLKDMHAVVKKALKEAGVTERASDEDEYEDDSVDWEFASRLESLRRSIERPLEALYSIKEPDANTVIYVTTTDKNVKVVNVSPISIGASIGPKLQQIDSVIVTSATIAVNGGFDDIKRQLGLNCSSVYSSTREKPPQVEELILESPFDYNRQALLYTPRHLPLPAAPIPGLEREKYIRTLSAECLRLIRASDGNAFILFTSNQDLKEVHAALLEEDLPNELIPQGDDAEAAYKKFMATPRSVVFGNKSFWEGVDVVGDKLRLVVITKLPFPLVSDPVLQARSRLLKAEKLAAGSSEQTANTAVFQNIQIPQMITDLRQGAGRLIRSKTDRGVLAILDSRVWTGSSKKLPTPEQKTYLGYGALAVNAIGFSNRVSDFTIVSKFLQKLRQAT